MFNQQKNKLHTPVLVSELISLFSKREQPQKILDCTFGRGGHSLALVKHFPEVCITGLDCDNQAIEYGSSLQAVKQEKIKLLKRNFHKFPNSSEKRAIYNMILMDLGVSSPQLDDKKRGFSFYQDGPLDMRMDREQKLKADNIVNSWNKKELIKLFQSYGEIKSPYKTVDAILKQRRKKKFESTLELSHLIQKYNPPKKRNKHIATPWFLALRMAVNQELEGLKACLPDFLPLLKKQGFFVVISFHSLEDRIVKKLFANLFLKKKVSFGIKKLFAPALKKEKKIQEAEALK